MTPEEVKPGMEFNYEDLAGCWVEVEAIDREYALCRSYSCFASSRDKVLLVDLCGKLWKRIR